MYGKSVIVPSRDGGIDPRLKRGEDEREKLKKRKSPQRTAG
jgi:hypothetical protein